jgi:hypothetical protein
MSAQTSAVACFLPICYKNYLCSIKYIKAVQFSMGCCVEGKRQPQQNVRRLPRLDYTRSQAQERQNGRAVSWPVGARRATRQYGRY